jgi:glucuronoarabinoxylan endo-1,4-beta-xylanase
MAYYGNWITNHPNKAAIYAALFGELRPCLLRFRNTYRMNGRDAPITDEMRVDAELYAAAKATLGYAPTVLLTSWSPPAEFKESGQTLGGCPGTAIKFHTDRGFVYEELAWWWVDSVEAYRQSGVPVRYASLQNEPDYDTAGHDCCKFELEERRHSPGYNKLVFATHRLMHKEMRDPPGLVGPEHTKIDGYLPSGRLLEKLEAVGNHLYGSGDFEQPDSLLPSIRAAGKWAKANQKDLWCTEFGKLTDHETDDCLKLGQIVLNTLVLGGVSVYAHWDLFWCVSVAFTRVELLIVARRHAQHRLTIFLSIVFRYVL